MSWLPVYSLLAFIPALIALYFLKLRRQERVVSSTVLWRRSVEDLHVNAPFQRLRRSLLLLLQLIILVGLILALWRPHTIGKLEPGRNVVLLIDQSASMAAREGGQARIDRIKEHARELIASMKPEDRAAILSFGARTQTRAALTRDRTALSATIDSVAAVASPTRLTPSLVDGTALASTLVDAEVHVLGDSCYGDLSRLPEEVKRQRVKFFSAAAPVANVAVIECDARQTYEVDRRIEVLAVLKNFGSKAWSGEVEFFFDDDLVDVKEVELAAGKSHSVTFDCGDRLDGVARVEVQVDDALDLDDRAWVRVQEQRRINVLLVSEPNFWIESLFRGSPFLVMRRVAFGEYLQETRDVPPENLSRKLGADVVLFNQKAPPGVPQLPSLYVGCLPGAPDAETERGEDSTLDSSRVELPLIIDWDRSHPVNRFLLYTNLIIESSFVLEERDGFLPLVESDQGPIIGSYLFRRPGQRPATAVVIGFDVMDTNWPFDQHYSFPIFFANALEWLEQQNRGVTRSRFRSGEALVYRPADREDEVQEGVVFRSPSGERLVPTRESNGNLVVASPSEVGVYEVIAADQVIERLPVGLLNARESNLEPAEKIDFGDFEVAVNQAEGEGRTEHWRWFAAVALVFVLIEWLVYNRRLGL